MRSWVPALALFVGASLATSGCAAPLQLYGGPPRPQSQVARLTTGSFTAVLGVDGQRMEEHQLELLPRRYALQTETRRRTMQDYSVLVQCALSFEARAGTRYRLEHAASGEKTLYYRRGVFAPAEAGMVLREEGEQGAQAALPLDGQCEYRLGTACRATANDTGCLRERGDDIGVRSFQTLKGY